MVMSFRALKKIISFLFLTLLVGVFSFYISEKVRSAMGSNPVSVEAFLDGYSNATYGISFNYPKSWVIQEKGSSDKTPFAVLVASPEASGVHFSQGQYPEKFINIVFYKTSQTEDEYGAEDLSGKFVQNLHSVAMIDGNGDILKKYVGDFKDGRYFATHKRHGEFLVIIETYLRGPTLEKEAGLDGVFSSLVASLQLTTPKY